MATTILEALQEMLLGKNQVPNLDVSNQPPFTPGMAPDVSGSYPQMSSQQMPPMQNMGGGQVNPVETQGENYSHEGMNSMQPGVAPVAPQREPWTPLSVGGGDSGGGLLSGLGSGISNYMSDPAKMARLAMGFNSMRLNPDQALSASMQKRIDTADALKINNKTALAVISYLRASGNTEAAKMVEANPAVANDLLKQIVATKYGKGASPTASGVQTDPNTGQQYMVVFDPKDPSKAGRVNVPNAIAQTPLEKVKLKNDADLKLSNVKLAQDKSAIAFGQAQAISSQIAQYAQVPELLKNGASTGLIQQYLPAMNAATSSLRSLANSLGITIINSATFGALSSKELDLALSTGIPQALSDGQLREYISNKIAAQSKLRDQLMQDARELASGISYTDYITKRTDKLQGAPRVEHYQPASIQLPDNISNRLSRNQIENYSKMDDLTRLKFINTFQTQ